jgi:hypothetical protein
MALIADFELRSSCLRFFSRTEKLRSFAKYAPDQLVWLIDIFRPKEPLANAPFHSLTFLFPLPAQPIFTPLHGGQPKTFRHLPSREQPELV